MAKKYQLTQMGVEVQALLDKMETLQANQTPAQGQETVPLESLSLNGTVYTIDVKAAEPESYQNLAELRRTGKLVPGQSYRITDYVATTAKEGSRSANHPFDIIVVAITENTLSEEAKAAVHDGDTYFTSNGAKLEAWELRYCFDNDANRFDWADTVNGKGVIYRLKDEWDNDVPFDFKSIQFKRHRVTAKAAYRDEFGCIDGLYVGVPGLDFGVLDIDANDYKWYYTFSLIGESFSDPIEDASFNTEFQVRDNDFDTDGSRVNFPLTDMVFANGVALQTLMSTLGTPYSNDKGVCVNTHYYESSTQLTMFGITGNNFAKSQFRRNLSIGICRHSSFGTDCQNNFILVLNDFSFVNVGEFCEGNVLKINRLDYCSVGNYFKENKIFNDTIVQGNRAGNLVWGNTFRSDRLLRNQFAGYIKDNIFGSMTNCSFDGYVSNCEFQSKMTYSTYRARLSYLVVPEVTNKDFCAVDVNGNIQGASDAKITLDNLEFYLADGVSITRRVSIEGDADGNIVATWKDGGHTTGVMKAPGANEWTEIPADYTIYEALSNKAQTIVGNESDQTKYPSTKAVADFVAGNDKVYISEWNVTPYADVVAALNDGKMVFCKAFGSMVPFTSKDSDGTIHFTLWEEEQDQYGDATNYLSYIVMLRNPATVTGNGWSFAIGNRQPFIDTTSETALTPQQDENVMKKISLHKVSKTGNFNDLINKPESMTASEVTAAVNTAWDNVMNA